jgi:hypothetical protein
MRKHMLQSTQIENADHHVVVVGAGFGGVETVHDLAGAPVRITIVDRRNHHLFQPLLYQVATASLATSEIAWPIRYLLRKRPEVTTLPFLRRAIARTSTRSVPSMLVVVAPTLAAGSASFLASSATPAAACEDSACD